MTLDLFQLRDWTVGEKVGLLFVTLFGLLLLLTVTALVVILRESNEAGEAYVVHQERRQRRLRDLRALWVGAVTFWLAWVSGPVGSTIVFAAFSFLALREYITLTPTRRGDHRSLILAFFVVTPLQYLFVGLRAFDLVTVFVPVYVFLAIPVVSALAGDPERFLERNAKIQWGITVCVYGLAHAPALLLLEFKGYEGRGAFLLFFLVMTTVAGQLVQEFVGRRRRGRPVARKIDRSFSLPAFGLGVAAAAGVGAALFWITPVEPWRALVMGAVAGACGSLGALVMRALKKDAGVPSWGNLNSITGAVGLLDRVAPLCFAAPVFFHSVRWYFV